MSSAAESKWKLSYQISPILLVGGVAQGMDGGALPIVAITDSIRFSQGLLQSPESFDLDACFAQFEPLASASLVDQDVATYPFANQAVAANATIANGLRVSMIMICPARDNTGYLAKAGIMAGLQSTLTRHNSQGGTYAVATPSYIYTGCLLQKLVDITSGESAQPQTHWQWDFYQPLLTEQQAEQAQNALMSKISSGTPMSQQNPTWSGVSNTVGQQPTLATPSVVPTARSAAVVNAASPFSSDIPS